MINGKPFTDLLGELENGDVLITLTEASYEVIRAVQETRKLGNIKLSIEIKPTGRASVEMHCKVETKVPEHDRPATTFFLANDGTPMRNDPNQPDLPLRAVARPDESKIRNVE